MEKESEIMNLSQEEVGKILNRACKSGADFADIFVTKTLSGTISVEDRKMEHFYRGSDEGAGIRVMKGDFSSYFYTNDLSAPALLSLAEKAADSIAAVGGQENKLSTASYGFWKTKPLAREVEAFNLEHIGNLMQKVNAFAWDQSPLIEQVTLGYGDVRKELMIANTEGVFATDCRNRKRFFVRLIAKKGNIVQTALSTLGDIHPVFQWDEKMLCEKTEETVCRVLRLLDARPAPSGPMTVVMSSEAGGTMVHEACGHGLEADHVEKGLSVYKNRLGQQVASHKISVVDDATLEGHYGSFAFDDEGADGRKNILIQDGVLTSYMYDYRTAKKYGKTTTGNGRRESYRYTPQVRMSNTYILPGKDRPGDILSDTKQGLFVKKMGGGQVNTTNVDFVFEVSEGYLIENGELTYPVRNATLTGNGPKTLSSVFAVGDDLGFAIGTCGKGGQSVPVGDAQPTLGLSDVIVGGTES